MKAVLIILGTIIVLGIARWLGLLVKPMAQRVAGLADLSRGQDSVACICDLAG